MSPLSLVLGFGLLMAGYVLLLLVGQTCGALLKASIWLVKLIHLRHPQGLLQVLKCFLRLLVLLVQQVIEDVFVSLYESLRVLLAMLQLFVSISLDSLQKCCESQLLRVAQLGFFLLNYCLHLHENSSRD